MSYQIQEWNNGELLSITFGPQAALAYSRFPHPLIAVDFNSHDNVLGISASAPVSGRVETIAQDWHSSKASVEDLLNNLARV